MIPGREGQSVEALVWQRQRLFSAGLDGNVNEIDLVKLQTKVGFLWFVGTGYTGGSESSCLS